MCDILTVKLNHNITRNLPIELICKIVSYMYKLQQACGYDLSDWFLHSDINLSTPMHKIRNSDDCSTFSKLICVCRCIFAFPYCCT